MLCWSFVPLCKPEIRADMLSSPVLVTMPLDPDNQTKSLLNATDALELVSGFFEKEWAKTDLSDVHIKQITGGQVNTLQVIWRDNAADLEPPAILIRHFGNEGEIEEPKGDNLVLSSAQQAIVHWEMSRRGWGPKIFGFFSGGRLEEYIDSHTLTAAESMLPTIRRDVARSYARLHSLQIPLRKDGFKLVVEQFSQSSKTKREQVIRDLRAVDHPSAREYATIFEVTDWAQELHWVSELFESHNCKKTVIHVDANHLNIFVKNYKSDCQVVLIDYETVSFSYRGFDIGGHFNERMYCYSQPDSQLTGYEAPDVEEQRLFCEAYLQELRHLGQEISEYDTVDHLVLEAEIGRLCQLLFTNLMCTVFDEVEIDPVFLSGQVHMMKTYKDLKSEFLRTHQA